MASTSRVRQSQRQEVEHFVGDKTQHRPVSTHTAELAATGTKSADGFPFLSYPILSYPTLSRPMADELEKPIACINNNVITAV